MQQKTTGLAFEHNNNNTKSMKDKIKLIKKKLKYHLYDKE